MLNQIPRLRRWFNMSTNSSSSTPEKSKPTFLSLPIELRLKIYKYCNPPRVLEFDGYRRSISGPAIHQADTESREETLKGYEMVINPEGDPGIPRPLLSEEKNRRFTYMVDFERAISSSATYLEPSAPTTRLTSSFVYAMIHIGSQRRRSYSDWLSALTMQESGTHRQIH